MPRFPFPLLPALALAALCGTCGEAAPDRTGPYGETAAQAHGDALPGLELAATLGCGACHAGAPAPDPEAMDAPSLDALAEGWSPGDLAAYLADPVPLRAGTVARMPDFRLDATEAAAVTLYLLREPGSLRTRWELGRLRRQHPDASAGRGGAIVDALNCAGCHDGTGREPWPAGPPVSEVRERVRPGWVRDYLAAPRPVRPFGYHPGSGSRMPDFRLSAAEADSLAAWLAGGAGGAGGGAEAGGPARPLSDFDARKAERLLRDHLACLGCHSLDGDGGRIAPALDGAATRLRPAYLRRVIRAPHRAAPASIMPPPLEDSATLALVMRYLGARTDDAARHPYLSLITHEPVRPPRSGDRDPATLYSRYCAACHGPDGAGNGFNAAYLPVPPTAHADSGYMSARSDGALYDGIHGGGHILGRSHRMPGFGGALSRQEIDGLVGYLRELCACEQPAWAVDDGGAADPGGVTGEPAAYTAHGRAVPSPGSGYAAGEALARGDTVRTRDFLGAEACAECHPAKYDAWAASTHGRAGGPPSPEVVIAPFDGTPMEFADAVVVPEGGPDGYVFRVRREGRPDDVLPVTGVVGGGHMVGGGTQGFLTTAEDGTLRFLPFDWSRDEQAWFCNTGTRADRGWVRIDPSLRLADCGDWPPNRVFGHTDRFANCQECHGSQVTVAWDPDARRFASSYADLRINCESCHGPGRTHVAAVRAGDGDDPAIRSLRTLGTEASLQVCFRCHALKDVVEPGYLPGRSLREHYALKFPILGDRPYFPDGRVRTFAYQGNHLYSACYFDGSMTCTDCHSPHSNEYRDVWRDPLPHRFDDGQCLACHASMADDPGAHTRHPPDSDGSRCVACHMPYLQHPELGDDIRFARSDHVISIPRPAYDDSLGLRSACVACHEDRSPDSLQAATERWWGPLKPHHPLVAGLLDAPGLSDRLQVARRVLRPELRHPIAQFAGLAHLLEEHLGPDMAALEPEIVERLTALTRQADVDVRALALATLHYVAGDQPGTREVLRDALANSPEAALRDRWALALGYLADRHRDAGAVGAALNTYRKALEVVPDDPRTLAAMGQAYRRAGRAQEAVTTLRRALRADPDLPLARVNLGIALQEAGRPDEAGAALQEALDRKPFEPLAYFSMGNLLLRAGRPERAEPFYERAVELDPSLYLGWFYLARLRIEQGRYRDALPAARSALEFAPEDDRIRQMVRDLERATGAGRR